jgi:4-alpha-glucanotransferase
VVGLAAAVHTFLGRTPAPLVGLSFDDLVGETEPVNLPGIGLDRYPSWQRRSAIPLERLDRAPDVRQAIGDQRRRARPGVWPAS